MIERVRRAWIIILCLPCTALAAPVLKDSAPVLNSIDVLAHDSFKQLDGLRVDLITNASGHDRARNPTIDLLHQAQNIELAALFGPEGCDTCA